MSPLVKGLKLVHDKELDLYKLTSDSGAELGRVERFNIRHSSKFDEYPEVEIWLKSALQVQEVKS